MNTATAAHKGVLLVGNRDLSDLVRGVDQQMERDYHDASTFLLDDREGLSGMRGSTARIDFIRKGSKDSYIDRINAAIGSAGDDPVELLYAIEGASIGKDCYIMKANEFDLDVRAPINDIVSGSLVFGATGGARLAKLLAVHRGTDALSSTEVQAITATSVPGDLELVFVNPATTVESAVWKAGDDDATLKSLLESIYPGQTVTLSGAFTTSTDATTGETLYSGTRTIAFSEAVNVRQVQVRAAEQQRWVVTNGDADADYAYNGATARALGQTAAQIQTDLRTLGGNYGAVVVKGESAAPSAGTSLATGGTPFASSEFGAGETANAFDGSTGSSWSAGTDVLPAWLGYDLGVGNAAIVTSYKVFDSSGNTRNPTNWQFQGSNDSTNGSDGTWDTLDTKTGADFTSGSVEATFANSTAYRFYRLYITAIASPGNLPEVQELEFYAPAVGSALYNIYFPYSVGNVLQGTAAGTGSVASTVQPGGENAAPLVEATSTQGMAPSAIYNIVDATGDGTAVDGGVTSSTGWVAHLHVLVASGTAPTLDVVIEHSDDNVNWQTLATFDQVTAEGVQRLQSALATEDVKRYVRESHTVGGTTPGFAFSVGLARHK